jgi:RHS repeat-associated protein
MALTDAAGDVDTAWDYDVFGGVRNLTGSQPNDFSFAGEQVDGSTGLQYLRARYYDPEVGRFLSRDPVWGNYLYAWNNPLVLTDPSGLDPWVYGLDISGPYWYVAIAVLAWAGSAQAVDYWCDTHDCDPASLLPNAGGEPAVTPPDPNDPSGNRQRLLSQATDTELRDVINELYRPTARIGDGGTADALEYEIANNKFLVHLQKAQDRYAQLERILARNLSEKDRALAELLYKDLQDALVKVPLQ